MPSQAGAAPQPEAADLARQQRAASVPASQRSPEVVGLLEASRLADQIDALLPLGADGGGAALPDSPAARESALRAMLKVSGSMPVRQPACDRTERLHS